MKQRSAWLTGSLALLLVGCGGGSSSSDDTVDGGTTEPTQTGVFLDSAVGGIGYRTDSTSGVTNAKGEFSYKEGEKVVFFIGDLEFPPVTAQGVVTPAEIGNGAGTTTALNILQILQTLDSDGDPSNGISIYSNAAATFTGVGAGLDVTSATFDAEVAATLTNVDAGLTLVSEEVAAAHFAETQQGRLLGSWVFEEGTNQRNVLSFIGGSRYVIFHEHDDSEDQRPGSAEFGTYTWNVATGTMNFTVVSQSDGQGGLNESEWTASITDNTLVLTLAGEGIAEFYRVEDASNPLVGGRLYYEEPDNYNVLTILSDSEYAIAHTNNQASYFGEVAQPLSGEFGTYTYVDGVFTVTGVTVDTDGDGGLYNKDESAFSAPATVEADGALAFSPNTESAFTFEPFALQDSVK